MTICHDKKELIEFDTSGQIAAFIAEPIQGIGGSVEIPEGIESSSTFFSTDKDTLRKLMLS